MATVPLLMFTALFESQKMAEALSAGVDAFCPKASDLGLLRAQVRNLLRRRAAEAKPFPQAAPRGSQTGLSAVKFFDRVVGRSGLPAVIASTTISHVPARQRGSLEHRSV